MRAQVRRARVRLVGYYFPSSFPQKSRSVVADHSLVRDTNTTMRVHKLMVGNARRTRTHTRVHTSRRVSPCDHEAHVSIDLFTLPCGGMQCAHRSFVP